MNADANWFTGMNILRMPVCVSISFHSIPFNSIQWIYQINDRSGKRFFLLWKTWEKIVFVQLFISTGFYCYLHLNTNALNFHQIHSEFSIHLRCAKSIRFTFKLQQRKLVAFFGRHRFLFWKFISTVNFLFQPKSWKFGKLILSEVFSCWLELNAKIPYSHANSAKITQPEKEATLWT